MKNVALAELSVVVGEESVVISGTSAAGVMELIVFCCHGGGACCQGRGICYHVNT